MAQQTKNPVSFFFKYISKEKKDVASIYFYAILNGLVQLSIPLGIQAIISFVIGATMATSIYLLIAFVVIGTWLSGYFQVKVMQIIEKIQQKIFVEYSLKFAEKLPTIHLKKIKDYYLPELVNRFFDIQNLQKGISKILLEIPTAIIQIVFGIILLSFYHPWFLAFGLLVIICVVIIFRITMKSGIESSIAESDKKYTVASWIEDVAASIKTFKMASNSKKHIKETDDRIVDYLNYRTSHFKVLLFQYKTIIGFKIVITFAMLAIGVYLLINQKLNIGAFIATEIVVLSIMSAVEKLIKSLESYYDVMTSLAKLHKVTNLDEEEKGKITLNTQGNVMEVEFQHVKFGFTDDAPIFHDLNFKLEPHQIFCISGSLGSGKSMLLNLMAGFYEPSSGKILYNKTPVESIEKESLRQQIGLYLEDMSLVKGTVLENIQLGNSAATIEEITQLAEDLGFQNFAAQFTQGLFTEISETNTQITFSTKKMIILLRTFIGSKKLFILEDPTDGFANDIQQKITDYLTKKSSETTILLVSNNPELQHIANQKGRLNNGTLELL